MIVASLYLHIPFCEHKCIYCDFYSIESMDPVDEFIRALKQEIAAGSPDARSGGSPDARSEKFSTIFFGGGTPSLLDPAVIGDLIELLRKTYHIDTDAEITLEANPEPCTANTPFKSVVTSFEPRTFEISKAAVLPEAR